jgi:hypothetical protein
VAFVAKVGKDLTDECGFFQMGEDYCLLGTNDLANFLTFLIPPSR